MADPGTKAIMIGRIDDSNFRAHLFGAVDKFSALSGVNVLAGKRREKPSGAFEKIGVGKLHPRVFFARHRVSGEESLAGVSSERFRGAQHNFYLCAADIGYKGLGRQHWPEPPNQI